MRINYWFCLCIFPLVITGCSDGNQQPALEELSLVSAIAFDYVDESSIKITVAMPQPAEESSEHTQTTSVQASLIKEGILQISNKSDRMVSLSQLRVAFFSEEFARKGKMVDVVEYLYRDTEVRENVELGIVSGEAAEVLTTKYPDKPNTSSYLTSLLQPRLFTSFSPFTDLHIFIYAIKSPLQDAQVPYLEMKEGVPEISKLALFKENVMVDTLSKKEGKLIQALTGLTKVAPMDFVLKDSSMENEELLLEFINANVNIKGNHNLESPKIKVSLTLQGSLDEYNGPKNLASKEQVKQLEKDVERKLETEIQDLITKFKKLQIDPVGFSEKFRMRYKGKWTRELTMKILENAEFDVNIDVKLVNIGTLEES